jgi:hypothetical protein
MPKGFKDPHGRMGIDNPDENAMFIEPCQFPDPFAKTKELTLDFLGVIVKVLMVSFTADTHLVENQLESPTTMVACQHFGNDLYVNRLHLNLPILPLRIP